MSSHENTPAGNSTNQPGGNPGRTTRSGGKDRAADDLSLEQGLGNKKAKGSEAAGAQAPKTQKSKTAPKDTSKDAPPKKSAEARAKKAAQWADPPPLASAAPTSAAVPAKETSAVNAQPEQTADGMDIDFDLPPLPDADLIDWSDDDETGVDATATAEAEKKANAAAADVLPPSFTAKPASTSSAPAAQPAVPTVLDRDGDKEMDVAPASTSAATSDASAPLTAESTGATAEPDETMTDAPTQTADATGVQDVSKGAAQDKATTSRLGPHKQWHLVAPDEKIFGAKQKAGKPGKWTKIQQGGSTHEGSSGSQAIGLQTSNQFGFLGGFALDQYDNMLDATAKEDPVKYAPASAYKRGRVARDEVDHFKEERKLPLNLQQADSDDELYPEYLGIDTDKNFPMTEVYGGAYQNAFRGNDRRSEFKTEQVNEDGKKTRQTFSPTVLTASIIQIHDAPGGFESLAYGKLHVPPPKVSTDKPAAEKTAEPAPAPLAHGTTNEADASKSAPAAQKSENIAANKARASEQEKLAKEKAEAHKAAQKAKDFATRMSKYVKTCAGPDTQFPSVVVQIESGWLKANSQGQMERQKKVTYEIFANSLHRTKTDIGMKRTMGKDRQDPYNLPLDDELLQVGKDNALERLDLALIGVDDQQPVNGPTGRPVWRGISRQEITALAHRFSELAEHEKLIVLLDRSNDFTIFTHRHEYMEPVMAQWDAYFRGCMYATANLGSFWWYAQAAADIDNDRQTTYSPIAAKDFPFTRVPFPRWLIKAWIVEYNADGDALTAKPALVGAIGQSRARTFPDERTLAFGLRLAIARDQEYGIKELAEITARDSVTINATFIAGLDNHYVGCIKMTGPESNKPTTKPAVGTRVKLSVKINQMNVIMVGGVVEDVFETDSDYCVHVCPQGKNADSPDIKVKDRTEVFRVEVKFPGDIKASTRERLAVESMEAGQRDGPGPHLPTLALGAPLPVAGENVEYLRVRISGEHSEAFETELRRHGLNATQVQACQQATEPGKGVSLIWGPAGTGKTQAMVGLLCALNAAGIKVLVCGPTNPSVTTIARKFQEAVGDRVDPLSYVRFTSALGKVPVKASAEADDDSERETFIGSLANVAAGDEASAKVRRARQLAIHEQLMADVKSRGADALDMGFATKKLLYIQKKAEEQRTEENYKSVSLAKRYLNTLERVRESHLPGYKQLSMSERGDWIDIEGATNDMYIKEKVNIVFVTNNSAAHQTLAAAFEPAVVLFDEAALASSPDTMVALAAFMHCIGAVLLAGDHYQMGPIVSSQGMNETAHLLDTSLFEDLLTDRKGLDFREYASWMLDLQYRQDPHLSKFVREEIYGGKLHDDESVKAETELQKLLNDWTFRRLYESGLWNGRHRICIDPQGFSKIEEGGTSVVNEVEANSVVATAFTLVQSGVPPEKIWIITPYLGQLKMINRFLRRGENDPVIGQQLAKIRISATYQSQGSDEFIVLLSLVQHDENDNQHTGFVSDSKLLTVNITRPKDFLIIFGNWDGWRQVLTNGEDKGHFWNKSCLLFKKFVIDCIDHGDCMLFSEIGEVYRNPHGVIEKPHFSIPLLPQPPKVSTKQGGQSGNKNKKAKLNTGEARVPDLNTAIPERPAMTAGKGKGKGKGKANMK